MARGLERYRSEPSAPKKAKALKRPLTGLSKTSKNRYKAITKSYKGSRRDHKKLERAHLNMI